MKISVLIIATFMLVACDTQELPPLTANDIVIPEPPPGAGNTAAYLVLRNNSDSPIEISSISSPQFERVSMHETLVENNIARMRPIQKLSIGVGGEIVFEPGGKHVMLMHPIGAPGTATLRFHSGQEIVLSVTAPFEVR